MIQTTLPAFLGFEHSHLLWESDSLVAHGSCNADGMWALSVTVVTMRLVPP